MIVSLNLMLFLRIVNKIKCIFSLLYGGSMKIKDGLISNTLFIPFIALSKIISYSSVLQILLQLFLGF